MAAKVSSLTGSLTVSVTGWTAGFKQAQRDTAAFEKSLRPITNFTASMGKSLIAVGGLVGGALFGMAKHAADYGDEMLEASQKTGIGTKQLAALRLVAEQSGSSFEGVTGAVTKLSKTMFEAASKGGDAAKVFAALGISIKDSTGHVREASDVLPQIAERFAVMKDGSEKTALAIKLFGKAGADLIPTLNQGAAGFKRASEAVAKYNVDIGDAGNKLGDDFNDSLKETGLATQGLANQIGVALLPALIKTVGVVNNVIAVVSGWAKEHPELIRVIGLTAAALTGAGGLLVGMSIFLTFGPKMLGNIESIAAAFMGLSLPLRIAVGSLALVTAAFVAFPEIRKPVLDTLQQIYQGAALVVGGLTNLAFVASKLLTGNISGGLTALKSLPTNVMDDIVDAGDRFSRFTASAGNLGKIFDMESVARDARKAIDGMGVSMDAFEKDTKNATDRVKEMWDSLKKENGEAAALETVLMRASAAHVSLDTILDKLGPTIKDVAGEMIQSTELMPEYIAHYNALRLSAEAFSIAQEEAAAANQAFNKSIFDSQQEFQAITKQRVEITHSGMTAAWIDATKAVRQHREELQKSTLNLKTQQTMLRDTAAQMAALSRAGYSAAQIESMLGQSIEGVAQELRDLGAPLDSVQAKILRQSVEAQKLRNAWSETFAAISDRLVDMIVDFDFSWKRLADIGKQTAKDLARSFLDGFFAPFKEGLASLGTQAADAISGIVFGTKSASGNGGGSLGGLAGAIAGLFGGGKGGGIDMTAGGAFPGGVQAALGGSSVAASAGMSAAMGWASVGASLIGPVAEQLNKIGAGRDSANEIIKSQQAFEAQLTKIAQDFSLSPTNQLKQIDNLWEAQQANLARFSAGGGENAVTANQSFATDAPWVSDIRSNLLKAGAQDGAGGDLPAFAPVIAPVFNFYGNVDPLSVRDTIMPAITDALDSGVRGYAEKWSQILTGKSGSTPAVAGI